MKNLAGMKYNRLTPIFPDINKSHGNITYWVCKCECGAELSVPATNLIRKHTTSCGCSMSKGEQKIGEILKANNIPFTKNKTFNDCRFDNGALAKFDFFIDNSYVLEFDGLQHLQDGIFGNSISSVEKYRQRDEFKNKWCKDNGIVLIRIPYQERNNLTIKDLLPESSDFIVR